MSQNIVPIGVGDGVTSAFTLPQNYKPSYPIYRYDWQGRQLLYPTPRTNYLPFSESMTFTSGGWVKNAGTEIITTGVSDPSGGTSAITISGLAAGYQGAFAEYNASLTGTQNGGVWLQGSGTIHVDWNGNGGANPHINVTLTSTWTFHQPPERTSSGGTYVQFRILSYSGDTATAVSCAFPMMVLDTAIIGAFIPTTSAAPVTLTDYTLSGTTVNLAQAPVSGAILDAQYPDVYDQRVASRSRRGGDAVAITPSDTFQISTTRGLFVAVGGNIAVTTAAGNTLLMVGVPSGETIPIRVNQVLATGTTATGIIGLY